MKIRYFPKRGTIWMDFKGPDGKRHRVPTGALTQAQAEAVAPQVLATAFQKPLPAGIVPPVGELSKNDKTMTLREAFKAAKQARPKWMQAKDLTSKESDFAGLLTAKGLTEDSDCSVMTREFMQAARAQWVQEPGKRAGTTLSASTINHRLSMASVLLDVANCRPHTVKFLSVEGNRRHRRVREEELQAVVQWCLANHSRVGATAMADLVLVGLHTTARMGELLALQWSDVYFDKAFAVIRDPKNGVSRDTHLNEVAKRILLARKDLGEAGPFTSLSKWQANALWRGAKEAMGLAEDHEFVFHVATRHEGLSRLGEAGLSSYQVQQYGGHKSIAASARYVKLSREAMKAAGDVLARPSN